MQSYSLPCRSLHDADGSAIPSRIDSAMKELRIEGEIFYQLCNANSTPRCSLHDAGDTTIPSRMDSTIKELQNEPPPVV
eukprot:scaffold16352_cov81-Skeletonema_marinoi.AAC.1